MSSPRTSAPRPAVLCILDGWGHRPDQKYNAILGARTPNFDGMVATCPQAPDRRLGSMSACPRARWAIPKSAT